MRRLRVVLLEVRSILVYHVVSRGYWEKVGGARILSSL